MQVQNTPPADIPAKTTSVEGLRGSSPSASNACSIAAIVRCPAKYIPSTAFRCRPASRGSGYSEQLVGFNFRAPESKTTSSETDARGYSQCCTAAVTAVLLPTQLLPQCSGGASTALPTERSRNSTVTTALAGRTAQQFLSVVPTH